MSYEYINTKHEGIYEYQTKTGKRLYRVRFTTLVNGQSKEISKQGFNKISAAKAFRREIESLAEADNYALYEERNRTLNEHWEDFKKVNIRNENWNAHTLETNGSRINFWLEEFKNRTLRSLETEELQKYIDQQYIEKDYSQSTMSGFYRMLNQLLKDALNEKYIQKNPLQRVSFKKPGEWQPKEKTLTLDEFYEYMETAEEVLYSDLYCAIYLLSFGLRRGEVYGIKSNALTFYDNGLTSININWTRTAKYRKGKYVKSVASDRIVAVDQHATSLLIQQIENARKIKLQKHNQFLREDDFIFINRKTGNPMYIDALNDAMDEVTEACGIKAHPHMLRHTFATNASALGVDGLLLQNYLGHADIDMTKHYAKGSLESAEKVMRMTEKIRKKQ